MNFSQPDLDFDGEDHELQLRLHWAANAARERKFWTRERACLAWMQGTTPDDSDMAWWNSQPTYRTMLWLELHRKEQQRMRRLQKPRRSFKECMEEQEAHIQTLLDADEERITRYMDIVREDFMHGRPCSISFEADKSHHREHSERLLRIAIERLSIPAKCLGIHEDQDPSAAHA
jgi:hypothetical protein